MNSLIFKTGLIIAGIVFVSYVHAQDLCSSYLDQVSQARSSLVTTQDAVHNAQSDVVTAQSNLTMCASDGSDCSMEEDDYNSAVDSYNEASSNLQSATDDYNNAVDEYNQCIATDTPPYLIGTHTTIPHWVLTKR